MSCAHSIFSFFGLKPTFSMATRSNYVFSWVKLQIFLTNYKTYCFETLYGVILKWLSTQFVFCASWNSDINIFRN